jgi:hypothetical protein
VEDEEKERAESSRRERVERERREMRGWKGNRVRDRGKGRARRSPLYRRGGEAGINSHEGGAAGIQQLSCLPPCR